MPRTQSLFGAITRTVDWPLFAATLPLLGAGLITINSFVGENIFFERQLIWIAIALVIFFGASAVDWRFLRRTNIITFIFLLTVAVLGALFIAGTVTKGAVSRFNLGAFFVQPSDPAKIVLILLLAKYFSRRHIEIRHVRHILVSGFYAFVLFALVFVQPDFGSAIILFFIWLGMVMVSGISKKHLLAIFLIGILVFMLLWSFVFADYQKARIISFLDPYADIQGTGYNAIQSTIAVGSGQIIGKGAGYGTQSRLEFLPEYETDFIFAAFSEEWGFVGALILFGLYGFVVWRIVREAEHGATNFETLYALGLASFFVAHFVVHVGMNIGLLPVTGVTLPFLSYGGSHLVTEFLGLGILMGMRGYRRSVRPDALKQEIVSPTDK